MGYRSFHKNVKIRIWVSFLFGIVQATTFPFMAIYFARSFGEGLTGILLAIAVALSLVSGTFGGFYADRIGRKKILVISEAIFFVAYLVMAMANSPWWHSPTATIVMFMITNICWGIYGPVDEAMLLDVTDADNRQLMYSIFYWMHNLTMAVGTSVGALLFEGYKFELFGSMGLVLLGSLFITIFFIEETYHPQKVHGESISMSPKGIFRNYGSVLRNRTFMRYALAGMLTMAIEFQMTNYIGIRLAKQVPEHHWQLSNSLSLHFNGVNLLGFLQTENTVLVVLLAVVALKLGRKFRDQTVLSVAIFLNTLGYSIMTFTNSPLLLFAAGFVATIGEVIGVPIRQAYLGDIAPADARSSYLAVNGMTFSGSRILASLGVVVGTVLPPVGMGVLSMTIGMIGLWLYLSIVGAVHQHRRAEQSLVV